MRVRRPRLRRRIVAEAVVEPERRGQLADVAVLSGSDQRDADALGSGAAGAPDAVHVALAIGGRVEVDDVRDAADVDPAGGDVGRDKRVNGPDSNLGERLLTLTL